MLVDQELMQAIISRRIKVTPLMDRAVQPASIDLHLGEDLVIPRLRGRLTCTIERIALGPSYAGWILNNSTPARKGLTMATALWFDPGWDGVPTLELFYWGPLDPAMDEDTSPIELRRGDPICQLIVFEGALPALMPYGHARRASRYQGQTGATPARPTPPLE